MAKSIKKIISAAAKDQLKKRPTGSLNVFVEENGPSFVEWSQKQKGIKLQDIVLKTNLVNIKKASIKAKGGK